MTKDMDPISLTVYGSAALAVISLFLPWIDAGMLGNKNGFPDKLFFINNLLGTSNLYCGY